MSKLLPILLAVLVLGCSPETPVHIQQLQLHEQVRVIHIVDGDTVIVRLDDGTEESLRIIGIDTPEYNDSNDAYDCYGQEAEEYLRTLIEDRSVHLVVNEHGDNRDKYGRLLRYIDLDGVDIGATLLREGYAEDFPWFPHPRRSLYRELEGIARNAEVGMWGECGDW